MDVIAIQWMLDSIEPTICRLVSQLCLTKKWENMYCMYRDQKNISYTLRYMSHCLSFNG